MQQQITRRTAGSDYTAASGTLTFAGTDGEQQPITVSITDDLLIEPSELFNIDLSNLSTALITILDNQADVNITDNDSNPGVTGISFDNDNITVNEDAGTATILVELTGAVQGGFTVDYATADNTAEAGSDYTAASGTLTFAGTDGEQQAITVNITDDNWIEPSELFNIDLSNLSTGLITILDDQANVTILDNDNMDDSAGLNFDLNEITVNEHDGTATVQVRLTGNVQGGFSVNFATSEDTAKADDYTHYAGSLNFSGTDGEMHPVTIPIVDDEWIEPTEYFWVVLSDLSTDLISIMTDRARINIIDNDVMAGNSGLRLSPESVTVNEEAGIVELEVSLTGNVQGGFTVDYRTSELEAVSDLDYSNTNGTLTFTGTDGETHTISIPITDDIIVEDPEQFELILENLSTNLIPILSSDRSVITIQDNDGNEGWPQDFTAEACDTIPDPETIVVNSSCTTEVSFNEVIEGTDDGCATEYTIRRTWTFTDCVGNTRTHEQLITVVDTVAPTFNEDLPQSRQVSCEDLPVAASLTAMDSCEGPLDVVFDEVISNQDACGTNYTITRTWTASDCAGNAITHTQVLEVRDEMAPSFVEELPQSLTVECNEVPAPISLTALDNCDTSVDVVFEETAPGDLNCADGFQITRVWTATDCSGNTISHTQVITVEPTGPITAGPYEEEVTVLCYQEVPPVPEMNFMGGCGDYQVEFTEEVEDVDSSSDYLIVRTWVVTDACGNQESFEQIIFVMQPQLEEVSFSICVEDDPVNLFDYLPEYFDQNGQFAIRQGNVTLEGSTFNPEGLEVGEYLIAYSSKAGTCEFLADFIIDVNSDCVPCTRDKIEVSETVTVNADGKNDYFEIKGVEYCPYQFDVMIFNRWGDKVYEKKNYQNDWGGYAPRNAVGSAGTVPSGTYYYIISILDTESKTRLEPVNGYIYIGAE